MKSKISIYILLALVCIGLQSCLFQEEDSFEDSSANRASADVERCSEILKSVPNGWKIEYYAGKDYSLGGYTLFCKFDGQRVTMASDFGSQLSNPSDEVTSLYKVISEQSTMLTFDTYNDLLHFFAQPNGENTNYEGDYEFIIMNASADRIELQGKKYKNTMIMTPLSAELNWGESLTKIAALAQDADFSTYKLVIKGQEIANVGQDGRVFTISQKDPLGQVNVIDCPFIYTEEGVKLQEPLSMNGVTMSRFKWDTERMIYICTDEGVDAKIEFFTPAGYTKYLGNYTLANGAQKISVSLKQKRLGKSYVMTLVYGGGILTLDLIFDYNLQTECIDLMSQKAGVYNGFDVYFYPGAVKTFYPVAGYGFVGKVISGPNDPLKISFTFNKSDPTVNSILFLYNDNGWYLVSSIVNPVLTKVN